jgi:NADH-quinone oxidoreductase subunit K
VIPTSDYLLLSGLLFTLGIVGVLIRRTAVLVFLSVELMLNAANLAMVAFARAWGQLQAQSAVFIVMTLAAAEVAIGLAILIAIFRKRVSTEVDPLSEMKG